MASLGKTEGSDVFDNFLRKAPPTTSGFVVPELGPILLALASFSAFALCAVKGGKLHL